MLATELSSRPKWRDLLFANPATALRESASLPFVIPSEAEGSAVSLPSAPLDSLNRIVISTEAKRSGEICGLPIQSLHSMENASLPLSSRAKPSDCARCQEPEAEFGCGKDVDAIHLENAVRFPLSPNAAATGESGSHRERTRGLR
jgi:hypothetical protein